MAISKNFQAEARVVTQSPDDPSFDGLMSKLPQMTWAPLYELVRDLLRRCEKSPSAGRVKLLYILITSIIKIVVRNLFASILLNMRNLMHYKKTSQPKVVVKIDDEKTDCLFVKLETTT